MANEKICEKGKAARRERKRRRGTERKRIIERKKSLKIVLPGGQNAIEMSKRERERKKREADVKKGGKKYDIDKERFEHTLFI